MRIETVRCHVLGTTVTRIVDFEGAAPQVICQEYEPVPGTCRLKRAAGTGGPLSRLLQRVDEGIVAEHVVACSLR